MSNRRIKTIGLLVAAALTVGVVVGGGGCKDRKPKTIAMPSGAQNQDHDQPHEGPRHNLGTKKPAGYVINVIQIGDTVKPKTTATFEIKIKPDGKRSVSMPKVVRAWIGNDRAEGVPKVVAPWRPKQKYFDADVQTGRLPAESQFWIELQTDIDKHYIPFDFKEK